MSQNFDKPHYGAITFVRDEDASRTKDQLEVPVTIDPIIGEIDCSLGNIFKITLTADPNDGVEITFVNPVEKEIVIVLEGDGIGGTGSVSWPANVKGNKPSTVVDNSVSVFVLRYNLSDTNWYIVSNVDSTGVQSVSNAAVTGNLAVTGTSTFTGAATFNGMAATPTNGTVNNFVPATGAVTVDWSLSDVASFTTAANTTVTFSNTSFKELIVVVTAGGAHSVTWPTAKWAGGTAAVQTSTAVDVYSFRKIGTVIYARRLIAAAA